MWTKAIKIDLADLYKFLKNRNLYVIGAEGFEQGAKEPYFYGVFAIRQKQESSLESSRRFLSRFWPCLTGWRRTSKPPFWKHWRRGFRARREQTARIQQPRFWGRGFYTPSFLSAGRKRATANYSERFQLENLTRTEGAAFRGSPFSLPYWKPARAVLLAFQKSFLPALEGWCNTVFLSFWTLKRLFCSRFPLFFLKNCKVLWGVLPSSATPEGENFSLRLN